MENQLSQYHLQEECVLSLLMHSILPKSPSKIFRGVFIPHCHEFFVCLLLVSLFCSTTIYLANTTLKPHCFNQLINFEIRWTSSCYLLLFKIVLATLAFLYMPFRQLGKFYEKPCWYFFWSYVKFMSNLERIIISKVLNFSIKCCISHSLLSFMPFNKAY